MTARFLKGLVFAVVLLVVGMLVIGYVFMKRSVPDIEGSAHVHGIADKVEIERDSLGVPHIFAKTDEDAYFGYGYAEAQDRLFQMEMIRRVGEGRLSELVGKRGLVIDVWARTIGFTRIARELWKHASPETKKLLNAYVRGVNAYIGEHKTSPGFEFDALKFQPENWHPEECFMIGRLMSWEMNFSYWTDAGFSDIALSLDSAHMASLFPDYSPNGATAIDGATPEVINAGWNAIGVKTQIPIHADTSKLHPAAKDSIHAKVKNHADLRGETVGAYAELREVNRELRQYLGVYEPGGGSNSIVLASSRTTTGGAILENDTHLRLGTPSRWYLAHLKSEEGLNVAGFGVPGLPVILAGRNEHLSWGITNGMADESDFFVESPDSTGMYYRTPRGMEKFVEWTDTIRVRDTVSTNPMLKAPLEIRQTIHGPILTDHPSHFTQFIYNSPHAGGVPPDTNIFKRRRHPVSLAWNGEYATTDELGGYFSLSRVATISEARAVLAPFATPILNICLAEAGSNAIAYFYIGRLPKRDGNEDRILLPRDGTNAADEWHGFTQLNNLFSLENPARGYIASANNPPIRQRPFAISNNWESSARADRIAQLIEQKKRLDTGDVTHIVLDVTSPFDRDIMLPKLLALYPDPDPLTTKPDSTWYFRLDSLRHVWKWDSLRYHTSVSDSALVRIIHDDSLTIKHSSIPPNATDGVDPYTELALQYLRNWDGKMSATETAPAIYAVFLNLLIENTYRDELGPDRYDEFIFVQNVPVRSLERIINDNTNPWWDNIYTTDVRETRDSILKQTFREALVVLAKTLGNDMRAWQWGTLHSLTYHHQLEAGGSTIAKIVNIESGPASGGMTTVSQASYELWNPYAMWVGPSMRMIADMKTNVLYAALPTGNSEAIFGEHYKDMLEMFKAGQYDVIPLDGEHTDWKRFELIPQD